MVEVIRIFSSRGYIAQAPFKIIPKQGRCGYPEVDGGSPTG